MSNNQVQSLNPTRIMYGILDSHIKRHHCINQNLKVVWSWKKFAAVVVVVVFFLPAKKMACRTFIIKGSNGSTK